MQGSKHYQEKLFVSFQLSERIPEDNFYHRLKKELNLSFLRKMTASYYGSEGQKSIDPVVFFKLMLIGYLENIRSDRKIIEQASLRLDMLYFLDYDIDEPLPWHSTLSRTRQLYGEELFLSVFRQVLGMCINRGMVDGRRQAVDSAYIRSNASMESLVEKSLYENMTNYFNELTDNEEDKKTESKKSRKRNTQRSNSDFISTTDPDARLSKKKYQSLQLNYSGQISVDTSSHVICGAMADFADKKDSQSLPCIVEQTCDNLKPDKIQVEEILADTNYSSGDALKYLEDNNLIGYIPNFGPYKNEHKGFIYYFQGDYYLCSQGVKLPFKGIRKRSDCDKKTKQYRSLKSDCQDCPLKENCTDKRGVKRIEDTVDKPYYGRMHQRVRTKKGYRMKKLRSSTLEPVWGTLLGFHGMKKVYTKGIASAHKQLLLACAAYNLKKWMRFKTINSIAKAMEIQARELKPVFLSTINRFTDCFLSDFMNIQQNKRNINRKWILVHSL